VTWFDVAESPRSEKSYAVSAYRGGSWSSGNVPEGTWGTEYRGVPLDEDGIVDRLIERLIQRFVFHNTWTVRVAPWYGKRGRQWKERRPTAQAAELRAETLFTLIRSGAWDPGTGPPPPDQTDSG
jgi:hypothetical protein